LKNIPENMLTETCKIGQRSACCRFIVASGEGIQCAKLDATLAKQINESVTAGLFTAQGDNCEGLPDE
jgi:hypothetical protein